MTLVHFFDIIRCQYVVGIDNKISVESFRKIPPDLLKKRLKRIAFAYKILRSSCVRGSTVIYGRKVCSVGAVVCHNKGRDAPAVGLSVYAVDEIPDDGFLVPGAYEDRIFFQFPAVRIRRRIL